MNTQERHGATSVGLLLIRLMLAVVFIFHGSQKLFGAFGGPGLEGFAGFLGQIGAPVPMVSAVLAGSAEFFGGILLGVGLLTRLAVIPMVFTMLVASFAVHGSAFSIQQGGMEYALTLAVVLTGLGLTGAGALSLDRLVSRCRRREKVEEPEPILSATASS